MPLKAVLFDLDDTLYDHQHGSRSALKALYERYPCFQQISLDELERQHSDLLEQYHRRLLRGEMTLDQVRFARFRDLLTVYGGTADAAIIEEVLTLYRETYYRSERIVAGAVALVEQLRAEGLKIALVTNNTVAEQMGKLERCGLAHLIDVLAISEAEGIAKPDPRIFAAALDRLGCQANEAVMIGDSWTADIEGAHAAGLGAIWLNRYERACPDQSLAWEIQALEPLDVVLSLIR